MAVEIVRILQFGWVMTALTALMVGLRLYVHIRHPAYSSRAPSRRVRLTLEGLVVFAWLCYLCFTICNTIFYHLGGMEPNMSANLAPGKENSEVEKPSILKVMMVQDLIYLNTPYAIKAHFLLFYRAVLFPPNMKKTWIALNIATVLVIVSWVSQNLLSFFACWPIPTNWATDETFCTPIAIAPVYFCQYMPHLATDLIIYFLPVSVLRELRTNITSREKLYVWLSFSCGFVCILFASIQITCNLYPTIDVSVDYLAATMECCWAIIVVCVPAFKLFLRNLSSSPSTSRGSDPESGVMNTFNASNRASCLTGGKRDRPNSKCEKLASYEEMEIPDISKL